MPEGASVAMDCIPRALASVHELRDFATAKGKRSQTTLYAEGVPDFGRSIWPSSNMERHGPAGGVPLGSYRVLCARRARMFLELILGQLLGRHLGTCLASSHWLRSHVEANRLRKAPLALAQVSASRRSIMKGFLTESQRHGDA